MTRRPGNDEPEPPGGRAAERLREFIDQRFPGGVPVPEGAREEGESGQPLGAQLERLAQTFQEIVEAQKRFESRLDQLEQTVQELVEARKRIEARLQEEDDTK